MSEIQYKAYLIFGPPGSGKGTVGAKLAATTAVKHISSGDIFRGLPKSSVSGKRFQEFSSKGLLVPDEVTMEVVARYLGGLVDTNRFDPDKDILLLDGLPRTAAQATLMNSFVDVLHLLVLDIPDDDTIVRRLQGRAMVEGRKDDMDETVIRSRIAEYKAKTAVVLDCYPASKITRINGANLPDEVFCDTLAAMIRSRK